MPELPEVETMRRGLLGVVGCRIDAVEKPPCSHRPILLQPRVDVIHRRLLGRCILRIGRLGKRVIVEIDGDQHLVIEPRMTGLVLLSDPPDVDHLRLRLRLSAHGGRAVVHQELLFWDRRGLGTVRLMPGEDLRRKVQEKLGVDALEISPDQLRARLGRSQRAVKVALLDQSAVAGVGNLYAAEILFLAGVDPRARCAALSLQQWDRIHRSMRAVLEEAIVHEGSTLSDGTYRNALNGEGGYQHFHRVYDRQGIACPRCHTSPICRIVQAQRSTFFCPGCQRKRGVHPSLLND